jgi:transcription initiation factor TFIIH subunit 1
LDDGAEEFHQIEIEDLQDGESSNGIVLEMADRQRYFEGGVAGSTNKGAANGQQLDPKAIISESRNSLSDWEATLSGVCFFTRGVSQGWS